MLSSGANASSVTSRNQKQQVADSLKLTSDMNEQSRRLAAEVAKGNANAELLHESAGQLNSNLVGLREMGGALGGATQLAGKLSRRRVADCALFTLVFLFFYLTCAYIVLKRLYVFRLFSN